MGDVRFEGVAVDRERGHCEKQERGPQRLGRESAGERVHGEGCQQGEQNVGGMKRNLLYRAEDRYQSGEGPGIQRHVGTALQINVLLDEGKDVVGVIGMERIDLRVGRGLEESGLIALHCLIQERQAQEQDDRQDDEKIAFRQQLILSKRRLS